MDDSLRPHSRTRDRTDGWTALGLLSLLSAAYLTFLFFYVPRLNNSVLSDREVTGWVGPIAERVARGDRPYVDFVLPIPPGSFALLALIQRAARKALLLRGLWAAGRPRGLMVLIASAVRAG